MHSTPQEKSISTRTPHAGSDLDPELKGTVDEFQPALPMRGVTMREGIDISDDLISTRTPHAGSDPARTRPRIRYRNFNPHSPCGE